MLVGSDSLWAIPKKISVRVNVSPIRKAVALNSPLCEGRNFVDGQEHMQRMKRRVLMLRDVRQKFGPHVFPQAKRQSFWKALFPLGGAPLPNGVIDWEEFTKEFRNEKE
jgi:hypothetical protein